MVLGDDVVINNNRVARLYQKYLAKLGVDCSEAKTHISNNRYEFAKRWIKPRDKVEVTGIPLRGIIDNFKNPFIVLALLNDYFNQKGNPYLCPHGLVWSLCELITTVNKRSGSNTRNK
jgi:hypothetical protein